MRVHVTVLMAIVLIASSWSLAGNVFSMPTGQKSLEFVTVGDPGNQADTRTMNDHTSGYGSVAYAYGIGKFEATAGQFAQFLNAVAADDKYELYNWRMREATWSGCGIVQNGIAGQYTYSVLSGRENMPVNYVTWGTAARFCNWLTNGQPTGTLTGDPARDGWLTEDGSYAINGAIYDDVAVCDVIRKPDARYVIPSEDEWYKAAYYKGGTTNAGYWLYPTKSDTKPSNLLDPAGVNNANFQTNSPAPVGAFQGSPGPYGTFDMAGNMGEWNEAVCMYGPYGPQRIIRGGYWGVYGEDLQALERSWYWDSTEIMGGLGFRIALVPEPATIALLALGGLLIARRRRA